VAFEDDELDAVGDADEIEYAFTNKLLTLRGSAEQPTRTEVAGSGTLIAELVTIGLSTGIGQAKGPGRLESEDAGSAVAWREQADVVFRVRDGWMTGSLEQAIASGGVELADGASRVTAQDLNARFAEAGDDSLLERVVLAGDVNAATEEGTLTADRVDVRFVVEGDESRPSLAVATGGVRGEQDGQRVWAEQIEADLVRDAEGETEVAFARAREAVRYERDDGTYAIGDIASIAAAEKTAVIEGLPGVVASGGATVEAERIELDDTAASIVTPSRGRLTIAGDNGRETVAATWTESMRYSDATGQLETEGDVEIVSTSSPLTRDSFRGDRLVALVEPIDNADEQADEADDRLGGDRRLVSAIATGTNGAQASAEFLRFAAPGDDEPVRVTAIVGERIEADNAAGVLRVPGTGRLVVSDTRVGTDDASSSTGGSRGSALFDWEGSMELDRPAGTATMLRRVRLVHRPMNASGGNERGVVELESERLDADL
jgi:lipopolysaccharide export system protein LptA